MENVSIKIPKSEIRELARILVKLFRGSREILVGTPLHYYNLRSLCKKFVDKSYLLESSRPGGSSSVRFNINEIETLLKVYDYSRDSISFDVYDNTLLLHLFTRLDRDRSRLFHWSAFRFLD